MRLKEFLIKSEKYLDAIVIPTIVSVITTFVFQISPLSLVSEVKDKLFLFASLPIYMLMVGDKEVETKGKEAITIKDLESGRECSVFLISSKRYNEEFSAISPLDRCYLTDYLKKLRLEKYKTLVFDLDLSPVCEGKNRELVEYYRECQEYLDNYLVELSNAGKRIILFVPFYSSKDSSPCKAVKRWKAKIESFQNIKFASPMLSETLGQIIFYKIKDSSGKFTLGALAFGVEKGKKVPINYVDLELLPGPSESSEVAFIGAGYNRQDKFLTLRGKLPGVVIHAMGGLSLLSPMRFISPEELELTVFVSSLSGLLAFFFFTPLWNRYRKYRERSFCLRTPIKFFIVGGVFIYTLVVLSCIYWIVVELHTFIIPTSILLAVWATLYYRYKLLLEVCNYDKPFQPPVNWIKHSKSGGIGKTASGIEKILLKLDEFCLGLAGRFQERFEKLRSSRLLFIVKISTILLFFLSLLRVVRVVVEYFK